MGFLDNLENSLDSLEKVSEKDDTGREREQRASEKARQAAMAPWAERLKKDPYTSALMTVATREGFRARTKVYITWIGNTLRLEARAKRLELRPTADGVRAVFLLEGAEQSSRALNLESDPADLIRDWLT